VAVQEQGGQEEAAVKLALELGTGPHPEAYDAALRRYQKRPGANLLSVFGEEYGRRLIDSIDGAWVAVRSAQGWHLARVIRRYEGEPVDFDEVRTKVATDWQEASARLQLARAVREIADQYELRLEFEEPGAGGRAKHESAAQAAALQDSVAQR
jgi:hypothetical protein